MYETQFGLTPRPFAESTRPEAYVPLPSRDAAIRRVRFGLEHGRGPALIFGAPGSGKTLIARKVAADLGLATTHLVFPAMPAADLLGYLADELHAPPGPAGVGPSLRRVKQSLQRLALRGLRPLLVVDEAHLIDDPATFEALRLLLNLADDGPPDLALLLVGGPEVLVRMPASLADRLTARALLGPLDLAESSAYILGRLASAGARSPLFSPAALADLHREADGLPRRLNRLADLSLLISYAEGDTLPDSRIVDVASREAAFDPIGV